MTLERVTDQSLSLGDWRPRLRVLWKRLPDVRAYWARALDLATRNRRRRIFRDSEAGRSFQFGRVVRGSSEPLLLDDLCWRFQLVEKAFVQV
jgi:hypothetical protein